MRGISLLKKNPYFTTYGGAVRVEGTAVIHPRRAHVWFRRTWAADDAKKALSLHRNHSGRACALLASRGIR